MPLIPGMDLSAQMSSGMDLGGQMSPGMEGASPGMGGSMMGAPQEPDLDPLEHLRMALTHAQAALVAEPDDVDSQALAKVVQGLYAILASRQKEQEGLMGGGNMRALSRAYGQV